VHISAKARNILELLAFNGQKFRGSRDPGHAPFRKIFEGHVRMSLGTRVSNLKSVALTVSELLAFNAKSGLIDRSAAHRHTETPQTL